MLTNQQWVHAKTPADITLEGISVELDWADSTINSIIVRDEKDNALRIIKGEYSGMRAMVPATVEKHRVFGTLCGSPFEQLFDNESEALDRSAELIDELGSKARLSIEKVRVCA